LNTQAIGAHCIVKMTDAALMILRSYDVTLAYVQTIAAIHYTFKKS